MIQYYIELQKASDVEFEKEPTRFRLQSDGTSWRRVTDNALKESDLLMSDVYDLIRLQAFDQPIELDGQQWTINPGVQSKQRLYYYIYAFRDIFPKTPGREQVASVIRQGDDRINNALILNTYGFFELREMNDSEYHGRICDPAIVMRHEIFFAGTGCTGEEAAMNELFIDGLYEAGLTCWRYHLMSGTTNFHIPMFGMTGIEFYSNPANVNIQDALQKIEDYRIEFEGGH